jgi:hypothetical protein
MALLDYGTWLMYDWPLTTRHMGIATPAWVVGLFVWATLLSFQWHVLRSIVKGQGSSEETLPTWPETK